MNRLEARIGSRRAFDVRGAALSAIQRGPLGVLPVVALTVLLASGAAVMILTEAVAAGSAPPVNEWVRGVAAAISAIAGLGYLGLVFRSHRRQDASRGDGGSGVGATTALLWVAVMFVLALIPVWLLAARTHPPTEQWLGYGFFDKRWLLASYLLATIGSMVALSAVAQIVRAALTAPASWRGWAAEAFAFPAQSAPATVSASSLRRVLLLMVPALAIGAYFFAPPWHVALNEVNVHENPMMSGVQAIANGAVPYIDEASFQYGPGSELIHYFYLQATSFDLASFRESTAFMYWIGATAFFAIVFLRLPPKLALIACLASVVLFPALQMISFQPDGSVDNQIKGSVEGVWGWPNPMRYLGVFAVAMLLPALPGLRGRSAPLAGGVALGAFWGLTCFISQENLPGGVMALATLTALLTMTQSVRPRALMKALAGVGVGFGTVAVAVGGYYAAEGELWRFLELYYLIPPAVADGYSNTRYFEGFGGLWGPAYHLLPALLACLCVLSLLRLHPLRLARAWSPERVLLVSAVVAAAVSHLGSIPRADPPHLINTMLALPVAIVLASAYLPRLLGIRSALRRWSLAGAVAVIPIALMPLSQVKGVGNRIASPLARVSYESPALNWQRADSSSVAARRLTPDILHRPGQWCCDYYRYPTTMREFALLLNQLHKLVGDRRVYVANFIDDLHPGAAYFLADLKPAPILLEPLTMVMNEGLLDEFLDHYRAHISEVEAVVAVYPNLPELKIFKRVYPDHRTVKLPYSYGTITVLTR